LAYGSEVQEFLRTCGPLADVTDRITSRAEAILQRLTPAADPDSENLAAELQSLRDGAKLLHSLLAGAMRAAQTPPNPVDWGRIHKADEAFQHGETKPFQRR